MVTTIPTIGFNVETVQHRNVNLTIWDVGGCDKIRPLWRHYYQNTDILFYFIDSNDRARLDETVEEFYKQSSDENLTQVPVLVFATKQDLPGAMTVKEIANKLDYKRPNPFYIQPCCGLTGEGLYEGLDWIFNQLNSTRGKKSLIGRLLPAPRSSAEAEVPSIPFHRLCMFNFIPKGVEYVW